MRLYDDNFDPFAPGADPNEPGTYVPPGVPQEDPNAFRDQFPADWNYGQVGQNEAYNPFNTPGLPRTSTTTQGMSEAEGRAHDAERGLFGGYFDTRTGRWVSGEPRSSGGGGSGGPAFSGGGMEMPSYGGGGDYPAFESAGPFNPRRDTFDVKPFAYDAFSPSSWGDAENEPGYKASREQLKQRVEAGAAHRGILRSGMTLGDIYTNLDALSQQNFAQFDDRRVRNYGVNRGNAFENWSANTGAERNKFLDEYNIDKDRHSFASTEVDRKNNYGFNVADSKAKDSLARWQEQVRSLTQLGRPV